MSSIVSELTRLPTRAVRSAKVRHAAFLILVLLSALPVTVGGSPGLDVQGHRGCRGLRPENTLPAFEKALKLGVTTLEMDIQTTSDRVLVVTHDQQLNAKHCVSATGDRVPRDPFKDLRFEQLAQIDCGSRPSSKFPEQKPVPGAGIPRLEQVFDLARDADYPVQLSIEIKMQKRKHGIPIDEVARLLVDLVRRYGFETRTIVQSFDAEALNAVKELAPELRRSVLVRSRSNYDRLLRETGSPILSPRYDRLKRKDVTRFQEQGIHVIPWTVNKPDDIRRMIAWGVDGIIPDYPDRVLAALNEAR